VTVTVSWSWPGARYYPSVYHMCEPCADVFCAWLENGLSAGNTPPDNLVVDEADGSRGLPCQTQKEAYE
jgi:hypothetical protein